MNILTIVTDYPKNESDYRFQFIHQPMSQLVSRGHNVDVIIAKPFFKWLFYKLKNIRSVRNYDGVNIFTLFYFKFPGFKFYISDSKFFLNAVLKFIKYHKEFKYQIVNGHGLPTGSAVNGISRIYNIPSVMTIHGIEDPTKIEDTAAKKLFLKSTLDKIDHIVLVGSPLIPYVQKFISESNKYSVISNGVNFDFFNSNNKVESSSSKFTILSISNLHEIKGLDTNILAIRELIDLGYEEIKYVIGGSGYDENRLRELVKRLELEDYVEFLGFVPKDMVPIIMKGSSLFSLPSRLEAFGIVYLEAMASGLPVIGTDSQGAVDIINHRSNGFLIKQDDHKAIASIVIELFLDKKLKERIVQNAKETVKERFSWERHGMLLEQLYFDLIER